jgi:hypothetical protein
VSETHKLHPGIKSLEPFDMAIGKMCREWAYLENSVTMLFLAIAQWDCRLPTTYPMASCIDFREKIAAIKLGVLCWNCRQDIVELVMDSLSYVDSQLRSSRNRFVHDIIAPADDGIGAKRMNLTYSHGKEPSTGRRRLIDPTAMYVSLEEMNEITSDIDNEKTFISALELWFRRPHDKPLSYPLSRPPPRLHLRRLQERQHPSGKAEPKRKPPQKPSAASRRKGVKKEATE